MMASAQEIDNPWKPLVNLEDLLISAALNTGRRAVVSPLTELAQADREVGVAAGALH
jgi:hypothetical protein